MNYNAQIAILMSLDIRAAFLVVIAPKASAEGACILGEM